MLFTELTTEISIKPLIKWAGGKRNLLKIYKKLFPKKFNRYHEPFLGSGAVFFFLRPKKAVLIDKNEELINFYEVVRDHPLELMELVSTYKVDKDFYYQIRELDPKKLSKIERAARFLYLNKTAYNGLWRVNSKGKFNVPFGRYKKVKFFDRENLLRASELLKNAVILHSDFEEVTKYAQKGDFVYLDPPYYPISETSNFRNYTSKGFSKEDHLRVYKVFRTLTEKGCYVMLSNSNSPFIRELFKDFVITEVFANRFINSKAEGRKPIIELVIRNYE
ncbi:MAG: DNA adenine methylase [Gammaproteobacteria bacterium]|nr:MAG: DNA adenine methylase [Gammaproteobacteria bacterium]